MNIFVRCLNFLNNPKDISNGSNNILLRQGIQFHWKNNNYISFDNFLETLSSRKRKVIKKERSCLKKTI